MGVYIYTHSVQNNYNTNTVLKSWDPQINGVIVTRQCISCRIPKKQDGG